MRLSIWIFLLTLVLRASTSYAAPIVTQDIQPINGSLKSLPQEEGAAANEAKKSTLQWETGNPLTPEEFAVIREEQQNSGAKIFDSSLRVGLYSGVFDESRVQQIRQFIALRYDFNKTTFDTWQVEAKIGTANFVHLMIGKKYPFLLEEHTAPYYRFAAGNILESTEGLGSIFNYKKFQAIAAIGLNDLFLFEHRLQLEIAASVAIVGPQLEASLGFAF